MAEKKAESTYLGPTIYILPEAMNKLDYYIHYANGEISGFGTVSQLSDNELVIEDVFIFEQESTSGGTDISGEDLALGLIELMSQGIDPEKLRMWWHSHGSMSAFFSGTDRDTMDNTLTDASWMISVVGNKAGDYNVRFDSHRPLRFWADNLKLFVWTEEEAKICSAWGCDTEIQSDSKAQSVCDHHYQVASEIKKEVDEKNKVPAGKSSVVYPSDRRSYGSWWEDTTSDYGYLYKDTKYCDFDKCYQRVDQKEKFCAKHADEVQETSTANRKGERSGPKDEKASPDSSFDYCDVVSCYELVSVYDGYYKGMVLCDEHFESFLSMEFKYGEFDKSMDSQTMIEIFEYYLLKEDKEVDWDDDDEALILEIIKEAEDEHEFINAEILAVDEDTKEDTSDFETETLVGYVDLD